MTARRLATKDSRRPRVRTDAQHSVDALLLLVAAIDVARLCAIGARTYGLCAWPALLAANPVRHSLSPAIRVLRVLLLLPPSTHSCYLPFLLPPLSLLLQTSLPTSLADSSAVYSAGLRVSGTGSSAANECVTYRRPDRDCGSPVSLMRPQARSKSPTTALHRSPAFHCTPPTVPPPSQPPPCSSLLVQR